MASLLVRGGTILTMNDELDIVEGDVSVRDGRIEEVGRVGASHHDAVLDAAGALVLPGFIQTHIHLCQTLFRGLADDLALIDWLRTRIWPMEAAHTPASLRASARLAACELLSGGTTAATWEEARRVYGPGGAVYEVMAELYAAQEITMLAAYPVYFGGISLNVPAVNPGSTEPNGIKVRVPAIKSFQLTGEALGYIPSPIPFSEAFTAVQTGVVDGVIGSGAEGYYASFRDVTK
ncbi:MAG: amidohydrolase family protein, partial [Vicinamibacterales bacterium]